MTAKRRFPLWFSIAWRLLASAVVPAVGVLFSVQNEDWTWFARSGALMVAQSIAFFGLAYASDGETELHELRRLVTPPEELSDKAKEKLSVDARLERIQHSIVSYGTAAIWAVLGTLVWGFGDLVGNWL